MSVSVVIGSNFGDEGKGMVTNHLTQRFAPDNVSVVRFNGGAQAGHTVELESGHRHVFSHFGSGALSGAVTILSEHFIVNPLMYQFEAMELSKLYNELELSYPAIRISRDCRVTLPIDVFINREAERLRGNDRHGSCGVGINETVTRYDAGYGKTVGELLAMSAPEIDSYLEHVCDEYAIPRLVGLGAFDDEDLALRVQYECNSLRYMNALSLFLWDNEDATFHADDLYSGVDKFVFEGAQGLLLDEHTGQFPYVTRSNTGSTNVIPIVKKHMPGHSVDLWYVTRAYLTRHGRGPLIGEDPSIGNTVVDKTNIPNNWQESLRFAPLDPNRVLQQIKADMALWDIPVTVNLVVTCCDHLLSSEVNRVITALKQDSLFSTSHNAVWKCSNPVGNMIRIV